MRSKLFVPCSRPEFFAKALAGDADALSFDLEDAVPEAGKPAARARLAEVLRSDAVKQSGKHLIVRVNGLDTQHFAADIACLNGGRVDLVNLPKVSSAAIARKGADAIEGAWPDPANRPGLLVNIETPAAVRQAGDIATAHPAVAGLQIGLNDLFETLGIDRRDPRHVHAALWQTRLGAGEAGRFAYDGAWPDLGDAEGFRAEAELARSLGYLGKSCIHPRQVSIANAVFDRGAELAQAHRLVTAAHGAAAIGHGAFVFEGRMVDAPAVARARDLLRLYGERA